MVVGDQDQAGGFGLGGDPKVVVADHLAAGFERGSNFTVSGARFFGQREHG